VPYEKLTDSEKEYDRIMSLGVIKALLSLGYCLEQGEGSNYAGLFDLDDISLKEAVIQFECKMMVRALEKKDPI